VKPSAGDNLNGVLKALAQRMNSVRPGVQENGRAVSVTASGDPFTSPLIYGNRSRMINGKIHLRSRIETSWSTCQRSAPDFATTHQAFARLRGAGSQRANYLTLHRAVVLLASFSGYDNPGFGSPAFETMSNRCQRSGAQGGSIPPEQTDFEPLFA
jgi:hypothetical protein